LGENKYTKFTFQYATSRLLNREITSLHETTSQWFIISNVGEFRPGPNLGNRSCIAGATQYKWLFGDTKQSPKDTAWGAAVSYTYKDTGKFYPRLVGLAGGCRDTINLGVVNARLLSTNQFGENLTVNLYPNPSGAGNEVALSIEGNFKSRSITVYNSVGSKVSSHRIEKGQQQITLNAAAPGIYFIEIEGSGNQIKWVVK
jgi:hypothetical protein